MYKAAICIASAMKGHPVNLETLSVEEEVGFVLIASGLRGFGG